MIKFYFITRYLNALPDIFRPVFSVGSLQVQNRLGFKSRTLEAVRTLAFRNSYS
jgi:hypothetical protein